MAGGKQTPRQKMINMMYLVLTALLALNISKDILKALTKIDNSLDQTVETVNTKNAQVYAVFDRAMSENPAKTKEWRDKAWTVRDESNALAEEIETMKADLIKLTGGMVEDDEGTGMVPKGLDSREPPANYLLNEKKGEELRKKIDAYRNKMVELAQTESTKEAIRTRFNTDKVVQEAGQAPVDWEVANFEHYPLAAILPFLTNIEADVRNTESDVIGELANKIGADDIKVTNIKAVVSGKSYVTQGSNYEAEIYLAAFDATAEPRIIINGQELDQSKISGGVGRYSVPATGVGEKKIEGKIILSQIGEDKEVSFTSSYIVAPPTVVISPTKMNVLYRGVDNPLEISVPGVEPSKIRVSGPGVSGSNGQYSANVKNVDANTINISVSVEEEGPDGQKRMKSMGSKEFRVKGLPPAQGMIYRRPGGRFARNLVETATIEAEYKDFPFDLPLTVTSFEVAIPGFPPEKVTGNKMNGTIAQRLATLKPNSTIVVRDIRAVGPGGLVVREVSAIPIDVN